MDYKPVIMLKIRSRLGDRQVSEVFASLEKQLSSIKTISEPRLNGLSAMVWGLLANYQGGYYPSGETFCRMFKSEPSRYYRTVGYIHQAMEDWSINLESL